MSTLPVTNAQIDSVLSGIGGTPYTRVSDVNTYPAPTRDLTPIEFEVTATGTHFWATYDQLSNATVRTRLVNEAEGIRTKVINLKAALNAIVTDIGTTYTYAKYQAAIEDLLAIPETKGYT